jgi:hypothetical protein
MSTVDADPKAPPPKCATCKFWVVVVNGGECHCVPPLAHQSGQRSIWPLCQPTDWCGAWQAKAAADI